MLCVSLVDRWNERTLGNLMDLLTGSVLGGGFGLVGEDKWIDICFY